MVRREVVVVGCGGIWVSCGGGGMGCGGLFVR